MNADNEAYERRQKTGDPDADFCADCHRQLDECICEPEPENNEKETETK